METLQSPAGRAVRLSVLASMTEAEWLADCPPSCIDGADVDRAERKGNRARELINACIPDPALIRQWSKDYEVAK